MDSKPRTLEEIANATPQDYLKHAGDPTQTAVKMLEVAGQKPHRNIDGIVQSNYDFLYVGPGSGLIIQALIDQGHLARGIETSRRGIASAPDVVRNNINWQKPWETSYPDKYFDVAFISPYMKELLSEEEMNATKKEISRISKFVENG